MTRFFNALLLGLVLGTVVLSAGADMKVYVVAALSYLIGAFHKMSDEHLKAREGNQG